MARRTPRALDRWYRLRAALVRARRNVNLPQTELADRMGGVARSAISTWETGHVVPSIDRVIAYAQAVGRDLCVVTPEHRPVIDLEPDDLAALLNGAQAAALGATLDPAQRVELQTIMAKLGVRT